MKYASTILLLLLGALLQSACSTQAVYTGESFSSDSPFRMRAEGEVSMVCESARRALLGQGYLIESAGSEGVKGRKAYKTEDTQNTFIEMNIVCLGELSGSTVYATGVLTSYALKKSTSSASVGLSALGSISLPIGQSADSLVKVSEETIDDKDFYKRFFSAVDIILVEMRATRESAAPVAPAVPVAVEPGPAPKPTAPKSVPPEPIVPPGDAPVPAAVETAPAAVQEAAPGTLSQPAPAATPTATAASPVPAPTSDAVLEPTPIKAAPVTAAAPTDAPAAPAAKPAPSPDVPATSATQTTPATVLEEFAAPRSEPFR